MTLQTFSIKQLRFTFTLAGNAKFANGGNQLILSGLRATADINYPGPPSTPTVNVSIFGMLESDMQALTALTQDVAVAVARNYMRVEANGGAGWSTAFDGTLINTSPDYDAMPNVPFEIFAQNLGYELLSAAQPTSFAVAADIATVVGAIVAKMGKTLQNDGVTGSFSGPVYFPGTPVDQLRAACQKANISWWSDAYGSITITPTGSPRNLPIVELTPSNGLVGYPKLESVNFIRARSYFNPALRYGGQIQISGSVQKYANGTWNLFSVMHRLSSLMPKGPWFTELRAYPPSGYVTGTRQ